jgi:hypothetical protein
MIMAKYIPYTIYSLMLLALIREYIISSEPNSKLLWSIIILSVMFVALVWFIERILKTVYSIEGSILTVDAGLSAREIDIFSIQSLSLSSYIGYGYRTGLGTEGYKMMYESGRMIYISPEESDSFIKELISVNEKIIIQ